MMEIGTFSLSNVDTDHLIADPTGIKTVCDLHIVELAQVDNEKKLHIAEIDKGISAVLPGIDSCIGIIIKTDLGKIIASHVGIYDCGVDKGFDANKFDESVYANIESENMRSSIAFITDDLKKMIGKNKISEIMIIGQDAGSEWPHQQLNDLAKELGFSGELIICGRKEGVNTTCSVIIDSAGDISILNREGKRIEI